jgi:hypothetical protein
MDYKDQLQFLTEDEVGKLLKQRIYYKNDEELKEWMECMEEADILPDSIEFVKLTDVISEYRHSSPTELDINYGDMTEPNPPTDFEYVDEEQEKLNNTIMKYYDKSTKTLKLPPKFDEPLINLDILIGDCEKIIFIDDFLSKDKFEKCIYRKNLSEFDKIINNLPISLTHIYFGCEFDKPIDFLSNLTQLTELKFGKKFNQPIESLEKLSNLTHLKFGECFNQSIKILEKLTNLTHLTMGTYFSESIDVLASLTKLQYLNLSWGFVNPINNLPDSITHLTLGINPGFYVINIPVIKKLPKNLTHLTFGDCKFKNILEENAFDIIHYGGVSSKYDNYFDEKPNHETIYSTGPPQPEPAVFNPDQGIIRTLDLTNILPESIEYLEIAYVLDIKIPEKFPPKLKSFCFNYDSKIKNLNYMESLRKIINILPDTLEILEAKNFNYSSSIDLSNKLNLKYIILSNPCTDKFNKIPFGCKIIQV